MRVTYHFGSFWRFSGIMSVILVSHMRIWQNYSMVRTIILPPPIGFPQGEHEQESASIAEGYHIFANNEMFRRQFGDMQKQYGFRNVVEVSYC